MTQYEHEPQPIRDVLLRHKAMHEDGTINKLGVLALVSEREMDEIDPLEVESNETLTEMVEDPATDLDTLRRIDTIAKKRRQYLETETPVFVDEPELENLSNQELSQLLLQGNISEDMLEEIARIARAREQEGGLSSTDD